MFSGASLGRQRGQGNCARSRFTGNSALSRQFGRTQVNDCLSKKGFPLFTMEASKVLPVVQRYLDKILEMKSKFGRS